MSTLDLLALSILGMGRPFLCAEGGASAVFWGRSEGCA